MLKLKLLPDDGRIYRFKAITGIDAFILVLVNDQYKPCKNETILKGDKKTLIRKVHVLNYKHGYLGACFDDKPVIQKMVVHLKAFCGNPKKYLENRLYFSYIRFKKSFA